MCMRTPATKWYSSISVKVKQKTLEAAIWNRTTMTSNCTTRNPKIPSQWMRSSVARTVYIKRTRKMTSTITKTTTLGTSRLWTNRHFSKWKRHSPTQQMCVTTLTSRMRTEQLWARSSAHSTSSTTIWIPVAGRLVLSSAAVQSNTQTLIKTLMRWHSALYSCLLPAWDYFSISYLGVFFKHIYKFKRLCILYKITHIIMYAGRNSCVHNGGAVITTIFCVRTCRFYARTLRLSTKLDHNLGFSVLFIVIVYAVQV